MQIGCTKILYDQMKAVPAPRKQEDHLFSWHAGMFTLHHRKAILLVNDASRFPILLYGLKAAHWRDIGQIFREAILRALREQGIRNEVLQAYMEDGGPVSVTKTNSRSVIAVMTQMIQALKQSDASDLNAESIFQDFEIYSLYGWYFKLEGEYHQPKDVLESKLREKYGGTGAAPQGNVISQKAYQCIITLDIKRFPVWRRVIVPANICFRQLHFVIQDAFGWRNSHLYKFTFAENGQTAGEVYFDPDPDMFFEKPTYPVDGDIHTPLSKYLPQFTKFEYEYDFGDSWTHTIEIEAVIDDYPDRYPVCIAGEGSCPPEDVGGEGGYREFLKAIGDPAHPEHRDMVLWGESQGYSEYKQEKINSALRRSLGRMF